MATISWNDIPDDESEFSMIDSDFSEEKKEIEKVDEGQKKPTVQDKIEEKETKKESVPEEKKEVQKEKVAQQKVDDQSLPPIDRKELNSEAMESLRKLLSHPFDKIWLYVIGYPKHRQIEADRIINSFKFTLKKTRKQSYGRNIYVTTHKARDLIEKGHQQKGISLRFVYSRNNDSDFYQGSSSGKYTEKKQEKKSRYIEKVQQGSKSSKPHKQEVYIAQSSKGRKGKADPPPQKKKTFESVNPFGCFQSDGSDDSNDQ